MTVTVPVQPLKQCSTSCHKEIRYGQSSEASLPTGHWLRGKRNNVQHNSITSDIKCISVRRSSVVLPALPLASICTKEVEDCDHRSAESVLNS